MTEEVVWQRRIIQSMRAAGGYGKKWASNWTVGVPDLILSHPTCGPVFAEVKRETACPLRFDRKLGISEKQLLELNGLHSAGSQCCLLVVVEWKKSDKSGPPLLVWLPHTTRRLNLVCATSGEFLVETDETRLPPSAPWRSNKLGFDMVPFLSHWKEARSG